MAQRRDNCNHIILTRSRTLGMLVGVEAGGDQQISGRAGDGVVSPPLLG